MTSCSDGLRRLGQSLTRPFLPSTGRTLRSGRQGILLVGVLLVCLCWGEAVALEVIGLQGEEDEAAPLIANHPYTEFASSPLQLISYINISDYVRSGTRYFGTEGYVNATEVVARLYGPGVTDPPSLDLVESAIAVQRYWLDGLGMETKGTTWAIMRSAPALKYPRGPAYKPRKKSRQPPPGGAVFRESDYIGMELRVTIGVRHNSSISFLSGKTRLDYMDVRTRAIARMGFSEVYFLPNSEVEASTNGLEVLSALPLIKMDGYTVLMQLEGPELVPFTVGKQTALQAALAPLIMRHVPLFLMRVDKIDEYFNERGYDGCLNITLTVAMLATNKTLSMAEAFSASVTSKGEGILALGEDGRTHLQRAMGERGLQVSHAVVHSVQQIDGKTHPVSLSDWVDFYKREQEQARIAAQWQLLAKAATAIVVGGLLAALAGLAWMVASRRQAAPVPVLAPPEQGERSFPVAAAHASPNPVSPQMPGGGVRSPLLPAYPSGGPTLADMLQALPPSQISFARGAERASWEMDTIPNEELEVVNRPDGTPWVLGRGSYGQVFKAVRDGVHEVAIKIFNATGCTEEECTDLMHEISLLRSCRHSNIVQFQGVSFVKDNVWLVMEFMAGGNLYSALADDPQTQKWYGRGAKIALDIARGLAYLHSRGVLHLDLKSPNVLLASDGTAKIADVGLSRILAASRTHASNLVAGSFTWTAPEVLIYGRASYKADIFSLGMILWELVTGEVPKRAFIRDVNVPGECPGEVAALIKQCMQQDAKLRPSAKEVIHALAGLMTLRSNLLSAVPDPAPLEVAMARLNSGNRRNAHALRVVEESDAGLRAVGLHAAPLSGSSLTFGLPRPGDHSLHPAAAPTPRPPLPDPAVHRHSTSTSMRRRSAPASQVETLWSVLGSLRPTSPPFGVDTADRVIAAECASNQAGGVGSNTAGGAEGALSERASHSASQGIRRQERDDDIIDEGYGPRPRVLRGQSMEGQHLITPNLFGEGLRSAPNPFADPPAIPRVRSDPPVRNPFAAGVALLAQPFALAQGAVSAAVGHPAGPSSASGAQEAVVTPFSLPPGPGAADPFARQSVGGAAVGAEAHPAGGVQPAPTVYMDALESLSLPSPMRSRSVHELRTGIAQTARPDMHARSQPGDVREGEAVRPEAACDGVADRDFGGPIASTSARSPPPLQMQDSGKTAASTGPATLSAASTLPSSAASPDISAPALAWPPRSLFPSAFADLADDTFSHVAPDEADAACIPDPTRLVQTWLSEGTSEFPAMGTGGRLQPSGRQSMGSSVSSGPSTQPIAGTATLAFVPNLFGEMAGSDFSTVAPSDADDAGIPSAGRSLVKRLSGLSSIKFMPWAEVLAPEPYGSGTDVDLAPHGGLGEDDDTPHIPAASLFADMAAGDFTQLVDADVDDGGIPEPSPFITRRLSSGRSYHFPLASVPGSEPDVTPHAVGGRVLMGRASVDPSNVAVGDSHSLSQPAVPAPQGARSHDLHTAWVPEAGAKGPDAMASDAATPAPVPSTSAAPPPPMVASGDHADASGLATAPSLFASIAESGFARLAPADAEEGGIPEPSDFVTSRLSAKRSAGGGSVPWLQSGAPAAAGGAHALRESDPSGETLLPRLSGSQGFPTAGGDAPGVPGSKQRPSAAALFVPTPFEGMAGDSFSLLEGDEGEDAGIPDPGPNITFRVGVPRGSLIGGAGGSVLGGPSPGRGLTGRGTHGARD